MDIEQKGEHFTRPVATFTTPVLPWIGGLRFELIRHKIVDPEEDPYAKEAIRRWHRLHVERIFPEPKPYWKR